MQPDLYRVEKKSDLPWAIAGLVFGIGILLNHKSFFSILIIIAFILLNRILARLSYIEIFKGTWVVKRPFKPAIPLAESSIVQVDLPVQFPWKTWRIVFNKDGEFKALNIHAPAFDLEKFFRDVKAFNPKMLGDGATDYLKTLEKRSGEKSALAVGIISLLGAITCLVFVIILSKNKPDIIPSQFLTGSGLVLVSPFLFTGIIQIALLFRLVRINKARIEEKWPTLILILSIFLAGQLSENTIVGSVIMFRSPGIYLSFISTMGIVYFLISLRSFFATGYAGTVTSLVLSGITLVVLPELVTWGYPKLVQTFGDRIGGVTQYGWSQGDEQYFWSVDLLKDDKLVGRTFNLEGEEIGRVNFRPVHREPESSLTNPRLGQMFPISSTSWIESLPGYILIRKPGYDIPDTLMAHKNHISNPEKAKEIKYLNYSRDGKYLSFITFKYYQLFMVNTYDKTVKDITPELNQLFPENKLNIHFLLGWIDNYRAIGISRKKKSDQEGIPSKYGIWIYNADEDAIVITDSSETFFSDASFSESGTRLWAVRHSEDGDTASFTCFTKEVGGGETEEYSLDGHFEIRPILSSVYSYKNEYFLLSLMNRELSDDTKIHYQNFVIHEGHLAPIELGPDLKIFDARSNDTGLFVISGTSGITQFHQVSIVNSEIIVQDCGRSFAHPQGKNTNYFETGFSPDGNRFLWSYAMGFHSGAEGKCFAIYKIPD